MKRQDALVGLRDFLEGGIESIERGLEGVGGMVVMAVPEEEGLDVVKAKAVALQGIDYAFLADPEIQKDGLSR